MILKSISKRRIMYLWNGIFEGTCKLCELCVVWDGTRLVTRLAYVPDDFWEGPMSVSQQLLEVQLIWFIAVTVTVCINWYLPNNMCHNLMSSAVSSLTLWLSAYCTVHSFICGAWLISNQSLIGFPWLGTHWSVVSHPGGALYFCCTWQLEWCDSGTIYK